MLSDLLAGTRHLGTDPVKEAEHLFGEWTLRLLLATLAVTPLRRITGWNWLAKHRRTLGLQAFGFGALHLLTWALLDVQVGISEFVGTDEVLEDILKRPFITMGMTTFVLLLPLAITSTAGWIRRLGRKWTQLHRLAYIAALTAVIHFWWVVKADFRQPRLWALALSVLLGFRAWWMLRARFSPS